MQCRWKREYHKMHVSGHQTDLWSCAVSPATLLCSRDKFSFSAIYFISWQGTSLWFDKTFVPPKGLLNSEKSPLSSMSNNGKQTFWAQGEDKSAAFCLWPYIIHGADIDEIHKYYDPIIIKGKLHRDIAKIWGWFCDIKSNILRCIILPPGFSLSTTLFMNISH